MHISQHESQLAEPAHEPQRATLLADVRLVRSGSQIRPPVADSGASDGLRPVQPRGTGDIRIRRGRGGSPSLVLSHGRRHGQHFCVYQVQRLWIDGSDTSTSGGENSKFSSWRVTASGRGRTHRHFDSFSHIRTGRSGDRAICSVVRRRGCRRHEFASAGRIRRQISSELCEHTNALEAGACARCTSYPK